MSSDGTLSWRELLSEATQRLQSAGNESAESDARRIVETAAGVEPVELFLTLDELVTERGVAHFDSMMARRIEGEPRQYVLGSWAFRTLDLMVDSRVLIPRPETEFVVEVALGELDRIGGTERETTVVDLGTGSGAIGLSIAVERVRTRVLLTDESQDALDVARANIAGIGRSGARVSAAVGNWFDALPVDLRGSVDMVVTNPPYVAESVVLPEEVHRWEPAGALWSGLDGLDDVRHILGAAGEWLAPTGVVVCEISPEQSGVVRTLALEAFSEAEVLADLTGRDRALVARRPLRAAV